MPEKFAVPGGDEFSGFGTFEAAAGPSFLGTGAGFAPTTEPTAGPAFLGTAPASYPTEYPTPTGEPPTGYLAPTWQGPTTEPGVFPTTGYVPPTGFGYEFAPFYPPVTAPVFPGGIQIAGGTVTITSPTTGTFRVYTADGHTYAGVTTFDLTTPQFGAGGTFTVVGGTMQFSGPGSGVLVLHGAGGVRGAGTFTVTAIDTVAVAGPTGPARPTTPVRAATAVPTTVGPHAAGAPMPLTSVLLSAMDPGTATFVCPSGPPGGGTTRPWPWGG